MFVSDASKSVTPLSAPRMRAWGPTRRQQHALGMWRVGSKISPNKIDAYTIVEPDVRLKGRDAPVWGCVPTEAVSADKPLMGSSASIGTAPSISQSLHLR